MLFVSCLLAGPDCFIFVVKAKQKEVTHRIMMLPLCNPGGVIVGAYISMFLQVSINICTYGVLLSHLPGLTSSVNIKMCMKERQRPEKGSDLYLPVSSPFLKALFLLESSPGSFYYTIMCFHYII